MAATPLGKVPVGCVVVVVVAVDMVICGVTVAG